MRPIQFITEDIIPYEIWEKALPIVRDVDTDDIAFVALNDFMGSLLWSGDKKLLKGIESKGYDKFITTEMLYEIRNNANFQL